ncbi:hypothetical protein B7P43_G04463 [Cryptotermes secundus]|uniref:C2H2-type domain-containing protein n=1 Tax=Cryptotermes secundus TaxID=105785 RepID=A0A2J7QC25_9NEOP|nr:hypothetical protein B7P43_G04463 [Cryptotermes secundus]
MASRSQKAEQNGKDMEQTHITSMVTSVSITLGKENNAGMSVLINTVENQECYQPEGELKTAENFKLEQTSKSSSECNHNRLLKFITTCRALTSPDDLSCNSKHTEHVGMRKPLNELHSVGSKSQQQEEPNQEKMDTAANHIKPFQQQCPSAAEPTEDALNNYMHELHDESHTLSIQEECPYIEEMHKDKINNCVLDMSSGVPMQQEEHHCLEELIKDEIYTSEVNIPSGTLMQHEWNSADKVIKDEISCEVTSVNMTIQHECPSPLDLNKEEMHDIKIKTPENVSHSSLSPQDISEGLDMDGIAKFVLPMSEDSSLKEEHLSLQENNVSLSHSEQSSPVSGPGPIQNSMTTVASTKMTVELMHSNVSAQNSPHRQEADLSVGTEDMPHLEVIDTEVSPYSSDSLEMPCLDLIADPVQPVGSDQVPYPNDICASVSNIPPLQILSVDMDTGMKENVTESGVDVQTVQRNDNLTLEVTFSRPHSVQKSEGSRNTEMSIPSQDQLTNSVDNELPGKQMPSVLTTSQISFKLERKSSTENGVVQKEPRARSHSCENSSWLEREASTVDGVIQKEPSTESHGLSPCLSPDLLQNDQHRYLLPEAQVSVTEECDGSLEKAVECEMQEVSVTQETLQVLASYLDSETDSVKVVEVEPEYMGVMHSDATCGWESLPLVTSDLDCVPSGERSQKHTTDATADEEMLASTGIGKAWPSVNLEDETSLSGAELSVCRTETNFNIESGPRYSTAKETEAVILEHSENVTLAVAALQETSDEPASAVHSEMLPGLDPSLGDVLPVDSVSNWPYLEEEVFSEFPVADRDSGNSLLMVPSSSPVPSTPTSNNGDTAECEASMCSSNSSQYNFRTQSGSNDTAVAIKSLKCCLSWKKIFALSKADRKKKKKQGTKNGENPKVTKEDTEFCTKSRQQLKECSKICHANDGNKLGDKYEKLNGNLKSQHDLKNKGVSGLELGPAKIEVRLAPTSSPRGHPKTWQVVDGPKSDRILNQGKPNSILLTASTGNSSCRSVAKDVGPLPNGVTQSPIVLVKRLILKRRSDDDSDADSDTKSKNMNQEEPLDANIRNLGSNNFIQASASSSEQTSETCDDVAQHCERLEDSEHDDSLVKECNLSSSSLMTSISSSQQTETQAGGTTDSDNSESEEDVSSHISLVNNSQEAGRKSEVCKSGSSSSIMLSEENDPDGVDPPADTDKTHDICDDSKHVNIYSDIRVSEFVSTNSSFSGEDNTKQQLPRVIIKRTIGMGNTNKYQSFLRSASSCSTSSGQWQPVVRLERNVSLDELAKSSAVDNEIHEAEKVPDSLRHGLRISLRSPPSQHHVTLVPLPSLACSSVDGNGSRSERPKKRKFGMFRPRINARSGNLNDGWNAQRYARRFTPFKSSFCVKHDTCPTSLPNVSGQLSSPKSYFSQKSPPIKLKFFSNCNRMQNGTLKMDRNRAIRGDSGDEYIVVENRNYTTDSMTKLTFQKHKRKEVSVRKGCRKVEIKEKELLSKQDIPTALNQNSPSDKLTVHDISAACSEDSNNNFNLSTYQHGTLKRRLSDEHDRESSKTEHKSHKKRMSDVSHDISSSRQENAAALEDTGNVVSEDYSQTKTFMVNEKPSTLSYPAEQSVTASKDYGPKSSTIKKRPYFEDIYLEKDVPPLFQPDRILSVSSTKKKRTSLKEKSPKLDDKALEEEIISLSAESQMDYSEVIYKELAEDTDVEVKGNQDLSTEGSFRTLHYPEECARETGSGKNAALLSVSSSEDLEPKLHKLSDCSSECVGNSSTLKPGEQQTLCNNVEHSVVGAPKQGDDTCQACGLVYSSYDERTAHIRRHPYHCQRCHLAFRSEVDFVSHLSEQHPRTRERHHCLLCERSFPTAERYRLHLSGRTHRHLELTQRRTIHTLFSIFTGHSCPVLTPLSDSELAGLKWFPVEPGTIHFYHQATPLQRAMQMDQKLVV